MQARAVYTILCESECRSYRLHILVLCVQFDHFNSMPPPVLTEVHLRPRNGRPGKAVDVILANGGLPMANIMSNWGLRSLVLLMYSPPSGDKLYSKSGLLELAPDGYSVEDFFEDGSALLVDGEEVQGAPSSLG